MPRARFADLPPEYRKVVSKMTRHKAGGGNDQCDFEVKDFLSCMVNNDYKVSMCRPEQLVLQRCVGSSNAAQLKRATKAQSRRVKTRLIQRFARYVPK